MVAAVGNLVAHRYAGAGEKRLAGVVFLGDFQSARPMHRKIAGVKNAPQADHQPVVVGVFGGLHKKIDGIGEDGNLLLGGDILGQVQKGGAVVHKDGVPAFDEERRLLANLLFSSMCRMPRICTGNSLVCVADMVASTAPPCVRLSTP